MSVKYKGKTIAGTWNIIDDTKPRANASYSSEKVEDVFAPLYTKLNKKLAVTKGVRDVVNTYHDLENYWTPQLVAGDIINVLEDETRDGSSTYYRWDGAKPFVYIGEIPPFYTRQETDNKLNSRQERLVSGVNIKTVNGESLLGAGNIEVNIDIDKWFPVGTIYPIADDNFDPAVAFGGTWEKIQDRFIRSSNVSEMTGGEKEVTLTVNTMPAHNHILNAHTHTTSCTILYSGSYSSIPSGESWVALPNIRNLSKKNNDNNYDRLVLYKHEQSSSGWNSAGDTDWIMLYRSSGSVSSATASIGSTSETLAEHGDGVPHNNMHPYYAVNLWKRTA